MKKFLLAGATLALAVASVEAQAPVAVPVQGQPGQAVNVWRGRNILGTKVFVQNNTNVGTVEDFVLDDNGSVEYVVVQNEGKLVSVPWDAVKFNAQQQQAVVNVTPQQWQAVPTFTTQTYPTTFYTPAYQTTTYKYFGVTPGQARRLDRRIDRRD